MRKAVKIKKLQEAAMAESVSIYKNAEGKARCLALYESVLKGWPVPCEQSDVPTRFGSTHVIASGPKNAPPLVLLHGQWASAMMWSQFVAELGKTHRVIALDQIDDVGKSQPTRLPASRPDYAQWLLEVMDRLELGPVDLLGLSYGGFLALNFAMQVPGRVKRLALLCPGVPSFGPPTFKWALHGLPIMLLPSRLTARWLVQGMTVKGFHSGDPESEQIIAGAMYLRSRIPFRPVFSDDEFAGLKIPVLLMVGAAESMYNAGSAVERARQLIPHIQAGIIPGAGHMLTTDQPEVVLSHILRFLQP
jgi:pimeloyl-ACP methyl ester carboxylesterase